MSTIPQNAAQNYLSSPDPRIAALAAALPHKRPHRLDPELAFIDVTQIPAPMLDEYLKFIHEPPTMFHEIGEADQYARFVRRWVDALHANFMANPNSELWRRVAVFFAQAGNFIPLYFNYENLKEIYQKRARILEQVLTIYGHAIDYAFPPRGADRQKARLGILSAHFMPQTETFATIPFYKHLNRDLFEIILFSAGASGHRLERFCAGHADNMVMLPKELPQQVQTIRQWDLDAILIATNVTAVSNAVTFLALHRLARVQVNSVCSCVSSGMSNNDYYISGVATEPAQNAQDQYVEKLRMVDGPAHCCDFGSEEHSLPTTTVTRQSLGLPADALVFASGSNFYKIIPEVEQTWARVLQRVPNSRLMLYPFNPNWSNAYPSDEFLDRLKKALARHEVAPDRLLLLPPVAGRGDIKQRLGVADVYLDSFPFSGITSLIDPLEMGLPPVVMEGNSFRSLMAPALMRELALPELVATSEASYIDLAVRLAVDGEYRAGVAARIRKGMAAGPKFKESRWYSAGVQKLLVDMFKEKQIQIPVLA